VHSSNLCANVFFLLHPPSWDKRKIDLKRKQFTN
jgi:hypothetical protein